MPRSEVTWKSRQILSLEGSGVTCDEDLALASGSIALAVRGLRGVGEGPVQVGHRERGLQVGGVDDVERRRGVCVGDREQAALKGVVLGGLHVAQTDGPQGRTGD